MNFRWILCVHFTWICHWCCRVLNSLTLINRCSVGGVPKSTSTLLHSMGYIFANGRNMCSRSYKYRGDSSKQSSSSVLYHKTLESHWFVMLTSTCMIYSNIEQIPPTVAPKVAASLHLRWIVDFIAAMSLSLYCNTPLERTTYKLHNINLKSHHFKPFPLSSLPLVSIEFGEYPTSFPMPDCCQAPPTILATAPKLIYCWWVSFRISQPFIGRLLEACQQSTNRFKGEPLFNFSIAVLFWKLSCTLTNPQVKIQTRS